MTSTFTRDQIVFVAETIMVGALDMIDWQDRTEKNGLYERGALEAAGQALSIFYAQLTDDGLNCYDALHLAGDFDRQVEAMMKSAWQNEGKDVKKSVEKRRRRYRLQDVIPNYPDCRKHAEKFADLFDEYLSPWEHDGVPLGNYLVQWPETDGDNTIRVVDEHGNGVETVNRTDPARWKELRDMMPDDALYFQPEGAGTSADVYRDFENAEKAHPDCEIVGYGGTDIEGPTFLDVEKPKLFWKR